MQRLRTRLPPVNTLVVFEAAARHGNFTRAAAELGVTREAVSRQIRILESSLGVKLFSRVHRAVELTSAGAAFHRTVQTALEDIAAAAAEVSGHNREPRITVTATVAIASYWLTPRLPRFRRRHPQTEIRVVVSDPELDLVREGIDVGLRYGDGGWRGVEAERLFECSSFPVCAPSYLRSAPPIEQVADLASHPLLNLDGPWHESEDWTWWLSEGATAPVDPPSLDIVGFDNYASVIQAALDGQGLALGFSGVVDGLLDEGRLVRPLWVSRSPGHSVYAVRAAGGQHTEAASDFYAWVLSEAARMAHDPLTASSGR